MMMQCRARPSIKQTRQLSTVYCLGALGTGMSLSLSAIWWWWRAPSPPAPLRYWHSALITRDGERRPRAVPLWFSYLPFVFKFYFRWRTAGFSGCTKRWRSASCLLVYGEYFLLCIYQGYLCCLSTRAIYAAYLGTYPPARGCTFHCLAALLVNIFICQYLMFLLKSTI